MCGGVGGGGGGGGVNTLYGLHLLDVWMVGSSVTLSNTVCVERTGAKSHFQ